MVIKYNKEKLETITRDLFVLTGMSIAILDNNSNFICKHSKINDFCSEIHRSSEIAEKCTCSDNYLIEKCTKSGKYESHICHAGLYDAIMPVMKNGVLVCYVMMGRVRCSESPDCYNSGDEKEVRYSQVPFFTKEQIKSMSSLLSNILFDEAVYVEINDLAEEIARYIKQHFMDDLRIGFLCEKFFISKNSLYRLFGNYYGITVNEYITTTRLDEAKKLLCETNDTVYSICEKIGFGNSTYFCRLFKKRFQKTPAQFRDENSFVSSRKRIK